MSFCISRNRRDSLGPDPGRGTGSATALSATRDHSLLIRCLRSRTCDLELVRLIIATESTIYEPERAEMSDFEARKLLQTP